jgi:hypothetical protein
MAVNKWAVWSALGVALLLISIYFEPGAPLVFGWALFIRRVVPRMTFNGATLMVSLTTLALLTCGVHWICRGWRQSKISALDSMSSQWRLKWSIVIVAGVVLMFAAGTCMIGATHQVGWLLTDPEPLYGTMIPTSGGSYHTMNSLRELAIGTMGYGDCNGKLPAGGTFTADGGMLHSWETQIMP